MIAKSKLQSYVSKLKSDNDMWGFNCWMTTSLLEGWKSTSDIHWMDSDEIIELLEEHTSPIDESQLKYGDILVYYGQEDYFVGTHLLHTAFYVGDGYVMHKPGSMPIERASTDRVLDIYNGTEYVEYVRPVKPSRVVPVD